MSRKHSKNRNFVRIGIFEGKSALYNKTILETLYEQNHSLTTWQIAKSLQNKLKETKNEEAAQSRAHKIYSVIQRKKGRLEELGKKHYITAEEGRWSLTWKGHIGVLINKPELFDKIEMKRYRLTLSQMRQEAKAPPNIKTPFGLSINGEQFKEDYLKTLGIAENNPSYLLLMVEETKQLIKEGINLDSITNKSLIQILSLRKNIRKALKKSLKETFKNYPIQLL